MVTKRETRREMRIYIEIAHVQGHHPYQKGQGPCQLTHALNSTTAQGKFKPVNQVTKQIIGSMDNTSRHPHQTSLLMCTHVQEICDVTRIHRKNIRIYRKTRAGQITESNVTSTAD